MNAIMTWLTLSVAIVVCIRIPLLYMRRPAVLRSSSWQVWNIYHLCACCLTSVSWCDILCQHNVPTTLPGTSRIENREFNVTGYDPTRNTRSMYTGRCSLSLDVLSPYKVADETFEQSQSCNVIINSPIKCITSKQRPHFHWSAGIFA